MTEQVFQSKGGFAVVEISSLTAMFEEIKSLKEEVKHFSIAPSQPTIYTNKTIKELLGIEDKLLRKYRDNGLLSYTQVGDKYWYTQADVDKFLSSNYYEAYRVAC